jgi:cell division protein FtsN
MKGEKHAQETMTLTAPQNSPPKMTTEGHSPSLYVIQYGVFRQQSGARERIKQLHTRGVAAVMSASSPYRVYGAVIPDRDQATAFGHMLRQADAEVLVKGWEWPLVAAVQRVAALPRSDIPDFITQNRHVMQWYSAQSSARLLSKEVQRTAETSVPSFVQARAPVQKPSPLLPQATAPRRNLVHAKMDDCFIRASEAWDAYTKRPLRRYLWDIQQQMLRYVALEHTFFMQEAVSVSNIPSP